ncbi:MAG: TlyA family RNA methyltransferase [Anaerolineales bacterium]|jgi:23S rRNA (cytidine1920-2'-O)/16S rRNA (cytidine1409-2'-O)-methyltransferase
MPQKVRVDKLLFERGLAESRSQAQRLVMAGQVRADGQVVPKPSSRLPIGVKLSIDWGPRFVSRGGEKLEGVFETFDLNVSGKICADVGASTGGFTDCLLQHGATKVYAIDVGQGILHWKLRNDPRVIVMEKTNARYLETLPETVDFITIDVSFISLKILLPVVKCWLPSPPVFSSPYNNDDPEWRRSQLGEIVMLIKPQFEAGRRQVARGKGVVRDPEIHRRVLMDLLNFAISEGFEFKGLMRSPLLGPKGNKEFLVWFSYPGNPIPPDLNQQVEAVLDD